MTMVRALSEGVMRRTVLAASIALMSFGGNGLADNFPSHPITIVVPFSAGGPSDAMTRILAERMKTTLGEAILVENVTGAGGSIGVGRAVRSPPDGYTISFGHLGTHVANGAIYKLGYDLVTDLEPVVLLPSNPMLIVSKNAVPANASHTSSAAQIFLRITSSQSLSQCHCEERSDEAIHTSNAALWIASRSPSSGAHSRDPLARNDGYNFA